MHLFWLFLSIISFIRLVRWLSFVQQKEYRWDRLQLLLFSTEGLRELVRVIPRLSDFSRTGLKRPTITSRIVIVASLASCGLVIALTLAFYWIDQTTTLTSPEVAKLLTAISLYIFIPLFVLLAIMPTAIMSWAKTGWVLYMAKRLVDEEKPLIVGITGSYGKTATKQLLGHLLRQTTSVFVTPKSFNTRYSVAQSLLQNYHSEKIALIEYGAYAKGEIAYLANRFPPSIAVITGFTQQHLGLFGSEQAIIEAKSELIAALPQHGAVLYNANDPGVMPIVKLGLSKWQTRQQTQESLILIGCSTQPSKNLLKYTVTESGYLQIAQGKKTVTTKLVGLHYSQSVELAVTLAMRLKQSLPSILHSLSTFEPGENFIQMRKTKTGATLIDDGGTTNPTGFHAALDLLRQNSTPNKIIITAGILDLGGQSVAIHTNLAKLGVSFVNQVFYVGWSGRAEFSAIYGKNCITDKTQIIQALSKINAQDCLLLEGRMPGWVKAVLKDL